MNDVEAYPQFLEGCVGAQVLHASDSQMEARLDLARGGISQSFVTLNELKPFNTITLRLREGPFDSFAGAWHFQALAEQACKVSLDLEFTVRSTLLGAAASRLFDRVANSLVDAVSRRAVEVYGS